MKTVTQLMLEEHQRLTNLFEELKGKINQLGHKERKEKYRSLLDLFFQFKWNLEKHFFIEEKVIISTYLSQENMVTNNDIQYILKEHEQMLEHLRDIEDDLRDGIKPKLHNFESLMYDHEKSENNHFYPKLDEQLDQKSKNLIRQRCTEIIQK